MPAMQMKFPRTIICECSRRYTANSYYEYMAGCRQCRIDNRFGTRYAGPQPDRSAPGRAHLYRVVAQ